MKYALALSLLAVATHQSLANDAKVTATTVEVRSGPSEKFYVTCVLHEGDPVRTAGPEEHGFIPIEPPRGSFSYVEKSAIELRPDGKTGVVTAESAPLRVGSSLNGNFNVARFSLDRGAPVSILGEATMTVNARTYQFYKVAPQKEVRYVSSTAIKSLATAPDGVRRPADTPGQLPDQVAPADLRRAQAAYRAYLQGQATGDFTEAKRLYAELVLSPNAETRAMALNYREFIRRLEQTPATGQANYGRSPGAPLPRSTSTYTHAEDKGARADRIPPTKVPDGAAPAVPASKAQKVMGNLGVSGRGAYKGQTLYVLTDSQGKTKCYVVGQSVNLGAFVRRAVELSGVIAYDSELRQDLMTVTEVRGLGQR